MNLLEIGKIVRVHGIKGAVKIISFVDESFKNFHHVFVGSNKQSANIKSVADLNKDAYSVTLDICPDVDTAQTYTNQSVYIDRDEYPTFKEKVYLSDCVNKNVCNENGEIIGKMVDFDDYGASVILTVKCGAVSYQIPFVEEIIEFNKAQDCFFITQQKFEDLKV